VQFKLSVIITKCSINIEEVNSKGERKRDTEVKKKEGGEVESLCKREKRKRRKIKYKDHLQKYIFHS